MRNLLLVMLGTVVFTLLLSSGVLAEYHKINESKRNDFNAISQHVNCRIQLTNTQLDLFSSVNSSITAHKDVLNADSTKLQELAGALNHKEFTGYITTTFKDHLKEAVKAVQGAKTEYRRANLTQEEKQKIAQKGGRK